jgi:hypothetical protein
MEKIKRYGTIAALLVLLGLVGQALYNRTQNGGQSFKDLADKIELNNACIDGNKQACEKVKKLEKEKP